MLSLPTTFISVMAVVAPVFSKPVWQHVKVRLTGAILAPGKRTVTSALCVMGRSAAAHCHTYHRVLNRAVWSPLGASRRLRRLLVAVFVPAGVVVFGLDETIERRRGDKIQAQGIDRDPVRSSRSHVVKVSGLRWLCCMLLTPRRWAHRVWALPLMTVRCPSEPFYEQKGRRAPTLVQRAWQIIHVVVRWLPGRVVVFVAESRYAALEWLHQVRKLRCASLITRLRLDAALDAPPPTREAGHIGRPRLKGARRPTLKATLADEETPWHQLTMAPWYGNGPRAVEVATDTAVWYHSGKPPVPMRGVLIRDPHKSFEPQALLSTHLDQTPEQILTWFIRRWTMEVTLAEARAHLGLETQRQWNARAIARTTPALLSLSSIITLTAHQLLQQECTTVRLTAW
jgi:DDE superfamily endonuclease